MWRSGQRYLLPGTCLILLNAVVATENTLTLPSATGAVRFTHPNHADAACTRCHHQRQADGRFTCSNCHTGNARRDIFHQLCTDCHLRAKQQGKPAGPIKLCSQCHVKQAKKSLSRDREASNTAR